MSLTAVERAARYGVQAIWGLSGLTDSYGSNTLVNNAGATFVAGKIGGAVSLALASSQSLSITDNAPLSGVVGGALGLGAWARFTTIPATVQHIAGKLTTGTNQREYRLILTGTTQRFGFGGSSAGTATTNANATTFGAVTTGVWYFIMGAYDPLTSLLYVSVNGGAFNTASLSGGLFNGTGPFTIGAQGSLVADFVDGLVDGVVLMKPPLGWTSELMAEARDFLYNAYVGREYPLGWVAAPGSSLAVATTQRGSIATATTLAGGLSVVSTP